MPGVRGVRLPQAPQAQPAASAPSATTTSACGCASGSPACSTRAASRSWAATWSRSTRSAFVDTKPYPERIAEAQKKAGREVGRAVRDGDDRRSPARGRRASTSASSAAAWAAAVGEAITRAAELALERRTPLLVDLGVRRGAHAGGLRLADADGEDEPGARRACTRRASSTSRCSPTRPTAASAPRSRRSATC